MLASLRQVRAAPQPAAPVALLAGPVGDWLDRLTAGTAPAAETKRGPVLEQVLYVLRQGGMGARLRLEVDVLAARPAKAGGYGKPRAYPAHQLATRSARFVTSADALIGRLMTGPDIGRSLPDDAETIDLAMDRMLATGRCHWLDLTSPALTRGPERAGHLAWRLGPRGEQLPSVEADDPDVVPLVAASPWYVDPAAGRAGRLSLDAPANLVLIMLEAPPVQPEQASAVRAVISTRLAAHGWLRPWPTSRWSCGPRRQHPGCGS